MSNSIIFLLVLIVLAIVILVVDNSHLKFKKKLTSKSLPIESNDFVEIMKNKDIKDMLSLKEPNTGKGRKEDVYVKNGKNILKRTSFFETQKQAFETL